MTSRNLIMTLLLVSVPLGALDQLVADRYVLLDRQGGSSLGAWPAGWGGAQAGQGDGAMQFTLASPN
jgi:hypothetical protein